MPLTLATLGAHRDAFLADVRAKLTALVPLSVAVMVAALPMLLGLKDEPVTAPGEPPKVGGGIERSRAELRSS